MGQEETGQTKANNKQCVDYSTLVRREESPVALKKKKF